MEVPMKKIFVALVLAVCLLGCRNTLSESGSPETDTVIETEKMATVRLNTSSSSRSVIIYDEISLQDAIDVSNACEAVFIKKGEDPQYFSFDYETITNPAAITVPVGDYDIIVLAGLDIDTPFKYLLASGYTIDRELVEGDNFVTITLQSVDVEINLPSSAGFDQTISASIIVNVKNPFISPGASVSIRSGDNSFSQFGMSGSETIEDSVYIYSLSGTTPSTGTAGIGLAKIHIGTWGQSGLSGGLSWTISDGGDGSDSPNSYTNNRFWKQIYIGSGSSPGLSIVWGNN
jgi:hypothetical protein